MPSYRPICDTWILARSKVRYYGAYPAGFLGRARALLGVGPEDCVLHLCSGKVEDYPFEGFGPFDITLDVNPEGGPDICHDLTAGPIPLEPGANLSAVLADPPYTNEDATQYGSAVRPSARLCLEQGLDVLPVGRKVGILHYVAPRPPKGTKFVALMTVFVGFDNRGRLFSVYEKR